LRGNAKPPQSPTNKKRAVSSSLSQESKTKEQSTDKKMNHYPKHLKNSDTLNSYPHATIKR
jgi:hypothetical protein